MKNNNNERPVLESFCVYVNKDGDPINQQNLLNAAVDAGVVAFEYFDNVKNLSKHNYTGNKYTTQCKFVGVTLISNKSKTYFHNDSSIFENNILTFGNASKYITDVLKAQKVWDKLNSTPVNERPKLSPFYVELNQKQKATDLQEMLNLAVECGAIAKECIIQTIGIDYPTIVNKLSEYSYIGVNSDNKTSIQHDKLGFHGKNFEDSKFDLFTATTYLNELIEAQKLWDDKTTPDKPIFESILPKDVEENLHRFALELHIEYDKGSIKYSLIDQKIVYIVEDIDDLRNTIAAIKMLRKRRTFNAR